MTIPLASSLVGLALGMKLDAADEAASNRLACDGISWTPGDNGQLELRVRKLEAAALRLAAGAMVLELGGVVVHELVAQLRTEAGVPQLVSVNAAKVELTAVKLQGLVTVPHAAAGAAASPPAAGAAAAPPAAGAAASPPAAGAAAAPPAAGAASAPPAAGAASAPPAADAWRLDPLGAADGTLRAKITDAMLLFDADVTVPVRHGQIDFNDATVEHVGPDSRMGVSRLGLYVDAPDGRSYLYQFASAPLAGVEFEQRGALLSPWVSERGKLQLQVFAESMLRQGLSVQGHGQGLTEQARVLLGRTALSGEVQLGDGVLAAPGMQVELEGRAQSRNAVGLQSKAVGHGVTAEIASLSARNAAVTSARGQLRCDEIAAKLKLLLASDGAQLRFVLDMPSGALTGLRLDLPRPDAAAA
jgi:hypothetical protein